MTAFKWTVRSRPKVSHALSVSQSGACSLIEETIPAAEPTNNQTTAEVKNTNTGNALERSAAIRAVSSPTSIRSSCDMAANLLAFCCSRVVAGSSPCPISPRAKIVAASPAFSLNNPLRNDQMNANNPAIDMRNVAGRIATVLSIL